MANRLAGTLSPYLRAHADNPVDWRPWGTEAFAEAERREVPILLSIGYATCHWCHVMARESFSDPVLAAHLNAHFVPVKVDREEHPDVDATYLAAAGAFTRQLGWPLTVFLTPEGRAFYAGTYFPPEPSLGLPSFRQVLDAVWDAWESDRDRLLETAAGLVKALAEADTAPDGPPPGDDEVHRVLAAAEARLVSGEDEAYGGFGGAPKFPMVPVLDFLLEAGADARESGGEERSRAKSGQAVALRALEAMAASALRDPVEGGFFRYATQRDWSVPHYERMLYDNAQLLSAYTRAALLLGPDSETARWAREAAIGLVGFLTGVLQRTGGGFGSAQDSESVVNGKRSEGGYYALDAAGRRRETPPAVDGKVLAGWNGLAISALADAGLVWDRRDWVEAGSRAADFILAVHRTGDGHLVRASLDGTVSAAPAMLEDYGLFATGLLHLALAGGGTRYALAGRALVDDVLPPEASQAAGARLRHPFRAPAARDPLLAAQAAPDFDSDGAALPAGEIACAQAAHLLWQLTGERRYEAAVAAVVRTRLAGAEARPLSSGGFLALARRRDSDRQVVVITPDEPSRSRLDVVIAALSRPGSIHAVVTEADARELAGVGFALFEGRTCRSGETTVYVCHDFVCDLPATDPAVIAHL